MASCAVTKIEPTKPIVIESKHYMIGMERWQYSFIDATGIPFISYEKYDFYSVGDTIK